MSDFQSPFLNNGKKFNNDDYIKKSSVEPKENENVVSVGNKNLALNKDSKSGFSDRKAEDIKQGDLVIQEEGKLFKKIIILLIILLVIALIWLILYNLFNKKNKPGEIINNSKVETNVDINDFDMKSEKFRVRSIIIE